MKLLHKMHILSLGIPAALACAVVLAGTVVIERIVSDLHRNLLVLEIQNVNQAIQEKETILERAGVSNLEHYIAEAQLEVIQAMRENHFNLSGQSFVLSAEGRVVYHPGIPEGSPAQVHFPDSLWQSSQGACQLTLNSHAEYCVYQASPAWGWILGQTVPLDEMYQQRNQYLWMISWIAGGILLVSLSLSYSLGTTFARRIQAILECTGRVERGDLTARIGNVGGADEIGILQRSINAMIGQVEARTRERQQVETALRERKQELRDLAMNLPGIVYQFYARPGREYGLHFISSRVENILGIDGNKDDFFERFMARVDPTDRTRFLESIDRAVDRHEPWEFAGRFVKPTGEVIWLQGFSRPNQRSGELVFNGILLDITRRRRAEQEKERLENQLRQSQKMEALGQLAGGVAHDFNNLLQAIQGYAEFAQEDLESQHPAQESLNEVMKATDRANTLVRQLLAFGRRETLRPEYLNLNDVVAGVMKMLGRVLGEHIDLTIHAQTDIKTIYADPGQMEQVLMNLCINSRDAMPEGGRITIEIQNAAFQSEFCEANPWARQGQYVLLSVSDTGMGMPPEVREHVFEPFFTTKDVGKGTGLGLATVYGIVKQHQGLINIYSEPDKGTAIRIYFPAVEEPIEETRGEEREEVVSGGTETILLAEDEQQVRDLAVQILEKAGYRVLVARDGEEAIHLYEQQADSIDLALLDVIMPKQSGRVVCDAVRAHRPWLPVLFSSGYSRRHLDIDLKGQPLTDLVNKPYRQKDLLRRIRRMLDQALERPKPKDV